MADCMQLLSENRLNGCHIFGRFGFLKTECERIYEPNFGFPHFPRYENPCIDTPAPPTLTHCRRYIHDATIRVVRLQPSAQSLKPAVLYIHPVSSDLQSAPLSTDWHGSLAFHLIQYDYHEGVGRWTRYDQQYVTGPQWHRQRIWSSFM